MNDVVSLYACLSNSAQRFPQQTAVEDPGRGSISYRQLDELSDRLRDRLAHIGVSPGDRVGFLLHKSINSIASIYGIMKAGAAYVPVDPTAPAPRNAYIFNHCAVSALIVQDRFEAKLRQELESLGEVPPMIVVKPGEDVPGLTDALDELQSGDPAPVIKNCARQADDLAYILYTSGSTGKPKGVTLTHGNATSFVEWCSQTFEPDENDRCSSHAPLHFDLSILDVHMTIKHAATLVLVEEKLGKDPARLAPFIAGQRLTIWYSAPSILAMLAQYGKLEEHDCSALRMLLFAGEVFPVKHLRQLKEQLPHPRYFNLYGPTETNVCTWHEIPAEVPAERTDPYPIGKCCPHLQSRVVDPQGEEVERGDEGELLIKGPAVTSGYWNLPEQTARAYFADSDGNKWYRTGDLVIEDGNGVYTFLGRRDRMVKKRGYRIELGEIESCLYQHPEVREAGVIAVDDEDAGIKVIAFLSAKGEKNPSIIALKTFCSGRLPMYMVPDIFSFKEDLPRTSTDKVDYQKLKEMV